MTIRQAADYIQARIVSGTSLSDTEIVSACGSDMMSDVMAFFHGQGMLLTGLINVQVVRTANLMDIKAVCFVRGKKPNEEMIKLAGEMDIVLMQTDLPMFTACGILYREGLSGTQE
ncbi:hypothetical protein [Treponema brennaborense]|uniref:DRTGG domain protein n=1 Tax=Treponema brennaborense (strain DSM 12168 / CIP 105900 / DD5/3) TaxID=906968 RepID=F4LIH4_TREBD|nr:hypothetical protein [Treponema brennaborense]AEE16215.1 DRTGG domain protein [Treponema brennaborense DSM 12168]